MEEFDVAVEAKKISDYLYDKYETASKKGLGIYTINRAKDLFYGKVVKNYIPVFDELFSLLVEKNHTKDNTYGYGDIDGDIWYEKCGKMEIVVDESHCTCADDNTRIYIKTNDYNNAFLVVTAYPKQKKNKFHFNDHRDIDQPSIQTYRNYNFEFAYGDFRDETHVLKYTCTDYSGDKVEDAYVTENKISHALENLVRIKDTIKEGW